MTHAQRVQAVAMSYGQAENDVARWPVAVVQAFHRNAIARGYLMPQIAA